MIHAHAKYFIYETYGRILGYSGLLFVRETYTVIFVVISLLLHCIIISLHCEAVRNYGPWSDCLLLGPYVKDKIDWLNYQFTMGI